MLQDFMRLARHNDIGLETGGLCTALSPHSSSGIQYAFGAHHRVLDSRRLSESRLAVGYALPPTASVLLPSLRV